MRGSETSCARSARGQHAAQRLARFKLPNREQLLEQILKLRRLAADVAGTPEGEAATRKVRELMRRYGISAADLKPKVRTSAQKSGVVRTPPAAPPASVPAIITLKLGNLRIRWKL